MYRQSYLYCSRCMREASLHSCCWEVYFRAWMASSIGFPALILLLGQLGFLLHWGRIATSVTRAPSAPGIKQNECSCFLLAVLLPPSQKLPRCCLSPSFSEVILHGINEQKYFARTIHLQEKKWLQEFGVSPEMGESCRNAERTNESKPSRIKDVPI